MPHRSDGSVPAVSIRSVRRWGPVVLAMLAGASLGAGISQVRERAALEQGPDGLVRVSPSIPVLLRRLTGPPNPASHGWPLASLEALAVKAPRIQAVEIDAVLPEDGRVQLVLEGGNTRDGVALQISRGRRPFSLVTTATELNLGAAHATHDWERLSCDRALPTPTVGPIRARIESDVGWITAGLAVGDEPMVTARCKWGQPLQDASIRAGLRSIGIQRVAVSILDQPTVTFAAPRSSTAMYWLAAGLGMALVGGLAALGRFTLGTRGGVITALALPLLAVFPLSGRDVEAGLQAMRLVVDAPLWSALVVPLSVSICVATVQAMAHMSGKDRPLSPRWTSALGGLLGLAAVPGYGAFGAIMVLPGLGLGAAWGVVRSAWGVQGRGPWTAAVLGGGVAVTAALLFGPRYGMAATYAAVVGMLLGTMVWANVARPRGFNLVSLLMVGAMAAAADQGLRWTDTGSRLTGRSARALPGPNDRGSDHLAGTFSSFEALENRRTWSAYPSQDYPVEPVRRRPHAVRVVALGGSSTGGAWQNDSLDEFWPAELERRHGHSLQVINQGVGGWTTLHIRRFLETQLDVLDPDLVVLYIGHNDILTESTRPYGDLLAAWQSGSDLSVSVSGAMARVPLYQLARFGLQSALDRNGMAAVPVEDARSNLDGMARLLRPRRVPILAVREGVAPDPTVLDPYGDMLAAWSRETERTAYLDTDATLTGPEAGAVFLDDCHLTKRGHSRVAEAVQQALVEQGWIQPAK